MALLNNSVTIHVGMPKSASTTLQKYLQNNLVDINYFGHENDLEGTRLFLSMVKQRNDYYNHSLIENRLQELADKDKPLVFSSEFACSYLTPISSGIPQDRNVICERFHKLAPQANIVIILRNQLSLHKSLYAQLLHNESFALDFSKLSFNKWIEKNIKLQKQGWYTAFEMADYYTLVSLYKKYFDNVYVFFLEEISKDMETFVNVDFNKIAGITKDHVVEEFSNEVVNARHNKADISMERNLNRLAIWFKKSLGDPFANMDSDKKKAIVERLIRTSNRLPVSQIKTNYSKEHQEYLTDFYRKSNQSLGQLLDKDLAALNYPI